MPEFRDYVAALAVAVSAASAGFSYYANTRASEANTRANEVKVQLDQSKFSTDTSIKLLEMTYTTFAKASTPTEKMGACKYASSLVTIEKRALADRESLIELFLQRMIEGNDIDSNCALLVGDGLAAIAQATPVVTASGGEEAPPPTTRPDSTSTLEPVSDLPEPSDPASAGIGTWHAVISSYSVNEKGCDYAKEDQAFFAQQLLKSGVSDVTVGIYVTSAPKFYAVSVDAGNDKPFAMRMRDTIVEIASSGEKKEGADSFVRQNRQWSQDPACQQTTVL
jgi:hypothetical protein